MVLTHVRRFSFFYSLSFFLQDISLHGAESKIKMIKGNVSEVDSIFVQPVLIPSLADIDVLSGFLGLKQRRDRCPSCVCTPHVERFNQWDSQHMFELALANGWIRQFRCTRGFIKTKQWQQQFTEVCSGNGSLVLEGTGIKIAGRPALLSCQLGQKLNEMNTSHSPKPLSSIPETSLH